MATGPRTPPDELGDQSTTDLLKRLSEETVETVKEDARWAKTYVRPKCG